MKIFFWKQSLINIQQFDEIWICYVFKLAVSTAQVVFSQFRFQNILLIISVVVKWNSLVMIFQHDICEPWACFPSMKIITIFVCFSFCHLLYSLCVCIIKLIYGVKIVILWYHNSSLQYTFIEIKTKPTFLKIFGWYNDTTIME